MAHIVNLGHGVLPGSRIECVEAFFARRGSAGVAARGAAGVRAMMPVADVSARAAPPLQRPGPALHVLPDGARCGRRASRSARVRGILAESAGRLPGAPVALRPPPVLRELCYFCGVHRRDHRRATRSGGAVPRRSSRGRSTGSPRRAGAGARDRRPAPLGRRDADLLLPRAHLERSRRRICGSASDSRRTPRSASKWIRA